MTAGMALAGSVALAGSAPPIFQTLDQYTRIQLPVTGGSSFRLQNGSPGETKITVDRVRASDFAALADVNDRRVQSVRVQPSGLDKAEIVIRFREPGTEAFAYQQGHQLVIDLWQREGHQAQSTSVKSKSVPAALPPAMKKAAKSAKHAEPGRHLASAARAAPSAPPVEPLRAGRHIFQKFLIPIPELALKAEKGGIDLPPKLELETRWKFAKGDKETKDGEAFEFAKKLFAEKKYGLTIKTIEIALRDSPDTTHKDELMLLEAFAYRKLGEATQTEALGARAESMFLELAARRDEKGRQKSYARFLQFYFGQKEYLAKNWLPAIQHFESVAVVTSPKDPDFPYVQLLLAESYANVNQPRRSERLYRFLAERFPELNIGKEGAYRIVDLLAMEKNYQRVIEEGEAALAAHPSYEKTRSEVLFQIGEASFALGQYNRAEKYFRRFVEISSAHTIAGLAWVRLGEIAELARGNVDEARKLYLRAKNGYPFSQADVVATVRLARVDIRTEKEPLYVIKTLEELLRGQGLDDDLKNMAKLALVDYFLVTGKLDEAINLSQGGMAQTEGPAYEEFKGAYMRSIHAKLGDLNERKRFPEALALFQRERKWFDLFGAESYRTAAATYRGLGLYATSNQMMERFNAESAKARGLASLAASPELQTEKAKNSFARGAYGETLALVQDLRGGEAQYMKAVAEFRLGQRHQAYRTAERAMGLAKESKLSDEKILQLGEILFDRDQTERDFRRMLESANRLGALLEKEHDLLEYTKADALWFLKRHGEAQAAYRATLEKYPSSARALRAKYNLGMSLVTVGKRDEAVKLLTEVRDSGRPVWSESAKQELELIEWEKKYSSVLRTLPPTGLGITN